MEIKDKPASMSVREWITKKIATTVIVPEKVIKQVIAHQYDSAHEATLIFNSIEISGFGKFYFNTKKAEREMKKYLEQKIVYQAVLDEDGLSEARKVNYTKRLATVENSIKTLIRRNGVKDD